MTAPRSGMRPHFKPEITAMAVDNGGPAFPMASGPEARVNEATHCNEGMSLRDWFAGQAIAGILANAGEYGGVSLPADEKAAQWVYRYADAMLAERNKERTP